MRKVLILVALLLLSGVPALAQQVSEYPRGEFYGGFQYTRLDLIVTHENAYGWHAGLAGNFHRNFGIVGDVSGGYGSVVGVSFKDYTYMVGPRFYARYDKATGFVHALFGGNHISGGGVSSSDFAWGAGGGVDANINKSWAWRVVQADYVQVRSSGTSSNNWRISTGIVAKWGTR